MTLPINTDDGPISARDIIEKLNKYQEKYEVLEQKLDEIDKQNKELKDDVYKIQTLVLSVHEKQKAVLSSSVKTKSEEVAQKNTRTTFILVISSMIVAWVMSIAFASFTHRITEEEVEEHYKNPPTRYYGPPVPDKRTKELVPVR